MTQSQESELCRKGHNDWAYWTYSKTGKRKRYCDTCRKLRPKKKYLGTKRSIK